MIRAFFTASGPTDEATPGDPLELPVLSTMAAKEASDYVSLEPVYDKFVITRILDVIRSYPIYNQQVVDQILDIAYDCEPSPAAPPIRFYDSREIAQLHIKNFAARHGYNLTVRRSDQAKVDLVCTRWTDPKVREADNDVPDTRDKTKIGTKCPFRLQLRKRTPRRAPGAPPEDPPKELWQLRIQHEAHNHGPSRRIINSAPPEIIANDPSDIDLAIFNLGLDMSGDLDSSQLALPEPEIAEEREPSPPALPPGPPPAPPPRFYDSREIGQQDINDFAASHGYSLTVRRSDQNKVDLVCSRWPDPANPRERKTNGTKCPFRLQMRRRAGPPQRSGYVILSDQPEPPKEGWELKIKNGEHNHEPSRDAQSKKTPSKKRKRRSDWSGSTRPEDSTSNTTSSGLNHTTSTDQNQTTPMSRKVSSVVEIPSVIVPEIRSPTGLPQLV